MKFFIKEKPESTQTDRIVKRFLWYPTVVRQVNETQEYRWLEWIQVLQTRRMELFGWSDWKDGNYILNKNNG
jgi:hypothetical protein